MGRAVHCGLGGLSLGIEPAYLDKTMDKTSALGQPQFESVRLHILANAARYFPFLTKPCSIVLKILKPRQNPVVKFQLTDSHHRGASIIAKWAPVYPTNNEGLTERSHYSRFNSIYGFDRTFRCPSALDFIHGVNVLLTQEEVGTPLVKLLRPIRQPACSGHLSLSDAVVSSAKWLQAFHRMEPVTWVELDNIWPQIEESTRNGLIHRPGVREVLGRTLTDAVLRLQDPMQYKHRSICCAFGAQHRDFGPGNILVGAQWITVLDAACNQPGPHIRDVASFCSAFALSAGLRLGCSRWRNSFIDIFLQTYFGPSGPTHDEKILLGTFEMSAALKQLDDNLGKLDGFPPPFRVVIRQHCKNVYRKVVETIVTDTTHALRSQGGEGRTAVDRAKPWTCGVKIRRPP